MRAEVEAHALLAAKHILGMQTSDEGQRGQPSAFPRPLQQFGACSRQEAASIDIRQLLHSLDRDATSTQREACNFRQRAPGGRAATCWRAPVQNLRCGPLDSLRETAPCKPRQDHVVSHFLGGESRGPHVASRAKPGMRDLQGKSSELQNEEPSATTSTSSVSACGTRLYRITRIWPYGRRRDPLTCRQRRARSGRLESHGHRAPCRHSTETKRSVHRTFGLASQDILLRDRGPLPNSHMRHKQVCDLNSG